LHDPGIIDQDIDAWVSGNQSRRNAVDAPRIGDVELDGFYAGICHDH
jgi:hypothetical protein